MPHLKLDGATLPYADDVKFLGMIFDSKLTWAKYIDDLNLKVKKYLNLLKVISGFHWGADKKPLLRIYDALCRSKLDYGCQIYSSASKSNLDALNVVHNMVLRICFGAFRTSPVESLYVDTYQLPLNLRREELGLRYLMRIKCNPDNPSNKVFCQVDASKFGPRSSTPVVLKLFGVDTPRQCYDRSSLPLIPFPFSYVKLKEKILGCLVLVHFICKENNFTLRNEEFRFRQCSFGKKSKSKHCCFYYKLELKYYFKELLFL